MTVILHFSGNIQQNTVNYLLFVVCSDIAMLKWCFRSPRCLGLFLFFGSAFQSIGLCIFSDMYVICPNWKVCSVKNAWCRPIMQLIKAQTNSLLIQRFPGVSSLDKIHIVWTQNTTHYACGLEDNTLYRSANNHRSLLFSKFVILISCTFCQSWSIPLMQCLSVMSWASYSFYFSRNLRSPYDLVTIHVGIGCRLGSQVSIPSRGSRDSFSVTVLLPARVPTRPQFQSATRVFSWGRGFKAARTWKWPTHLLWCWVKCLQSPINVHDMVLITRRDSSPSLSSRVCSDNLLISMLVVWKPFTVLSQCWHAAE